jgi:hypothetical protein
VPLLFEAYGYVPKFLKYDFDAFANVSVAFLKAQNSSSLLG